ncbi:hypothetical protein [Enterococcus casseliflavus]
MNYSIPITKAVYYDAAKQINCLIGGPRGMGKSWLSMYIANKLATLEVPTQLFIIDYKQSDASRLNTLLPEKRVACTKEEIFLLLEHFIKLMHIRRKFINDHSEFGSTALTLEMPLYYLWYDEFGAFTPTLTTNEKKKHDDLLSQLVLLGRQYNFGLLAIMQQISVTNSSLNSNIKQQFGMIAHMGSDTKEAYRQTFGTTYEIPNVKLTKGQGLIWLQGKQIIQPFYAPDLSNIDIWQKFKKNLNDQNDYKYIKMYKTSILE